MLDASSSSPTFFSRLHSHRTIPARFASFAAHSSSIDRRRHLHSPLIEQTSPTNVMPCQSQPIHSARLDLLPNFPVTGPAISHSWQDRPYHPFSSCAVHCKFVLRHSYRARSNAKQQSSDLRRRFGYLYRHYQRYQTSICHCTCILTAHRRFQLRTAMIGDQTFVVHGRGAMETTDGDDDGEGDDKK